MIPLFYELRRALTSKTVIILTAIIILFSLGLAVSSATSNSGSNPALQTSSFGYVLGGNGSYNATIFIYNGYGQPVQNSVVNLTLINGKVLTSSTDAKGFANFTGLNNLEVPTGGGKVDFLQYNFTSGYGYNQYGQMMVYNTSQTTPYFFAEPYSYTLQNGTTFSGYTNQSRFVYTTDSLQNQPARRGLTIFYEGPAGQGSPEFKLYYLVENVSTTTGNPGGNIMFQNNLTEANMTYYSSYSGSTLYHISLTNLSANSTQLYYFMLFEPNGTRITSYPFGGKIATSYTPNQVSNTFFQGEMALLGLFVPLMAAVSAYMTYGKDKTGGVLESVLSRPVSRKGLIFSRYLANTAAVFLAAVISFVVTSLVFYHYLGTFLPLDTFLLGLWALLVGIAGFIGLVYLASNFLKSQGALLGFAIAIFLVLDMFWTFQSLPLIPILILLEGLKLLPGGLTFARAFIAMYYISPTGYTTIAGFIANGSNTIFGTGNFSAATLGLTTRYIVTLGLLWIILPLAGSIVSFMKKD